jgi:hypothetical protein
VYANVLGESDDQACVSSNLHYDNYCIACGGSHYDIGKKCVKWEPCKYINNGLSQSNVMLMHLNIQGGFCNKYHELYTFLEGSNVDILCINEHCLLEDHINVLACLKNYKIGAYFCRKNVSRGGSCILLNQNYDFKELGDLCIYNEEGTFEACSIEIPSINTIVISIYRTPYEANFKTFISKLEQLLNKLRKYLKSRHIYIAGDFNVDILPTTNSSNNKSMFLNLISMYGFNINFCSPTRITENSSTCIDNILTNDVSLLHPEIQKSKLNLELGFSDHRALFIELKNSPSSKIKPCSKKRLFTKNNILNFCEVVSRTNWDISNKYDAQTNFNNFFNQFLIHFNHCFPPKFFTNKQRKNKNNKTWVTEGIKISSKKKRQLSKIAKTSKDLNFLAYYKNYRKIFKTVCDRARKMYNCEVISTADNKSQAVWNVVKSELGSSGSKCNDFPDILVGDERLKDGQVISDFFNDKYLNILGDNRCGSHVDTAEEFVNNFNNNLKNSFNFHYVAVSEVKKVIRNLKNKKTVGWDEIPVDIIKKVVNFIAHPICMIINKCFQEGIFPSQMKYAELKPLFKKGLMENPENYRPISILPTLSKVFEKIAYNQIYSFFDSNKLFANQQFGFRSGLSTISAVSDFINQVSEGLDGSQSTAAVFCDLSKAFDSVDYDILLTKLRYYKFSAKSLSWIQSYLTDRYQRTIIKKNGKRSVSTWGKIKYGVPQGSILGPLLFLIFVNDLPQNVSSNLIQYADDTTAIVKAKNSNDLKVKLDSSLLELSNWFSVNGLKLNSSKTQILKFQTAQNKNIYTFDLIFDDNILSFVNNTKFLGLNIDENLSWKPHISILTKKLNTACFQIYVLRNIIDTKTKIMVYYAMFFSHLQYGIELWGFTSHANKIFKIQKRFLRTLSFSPKRASCKPLFKKYEILTMPSLFIFKILVNLKSNFHEYLNKQFVHHYPTRFKDNLQYPRHRLCLYEKSPYYMSLRLYNKLPNRLKNIDSVSKFKTELRFYLLEKTFYSVSEFLDGNSIV